MTKIKANTETASFEKLKLTVRYWLLGRGYTIAHDAMEFAAGWHTGVRKDGTPEFSHQIWQASYARTLSAMLSFPEETIATIFLHDVLEDYPVKPKEIEDLFGARIADATVRMSKTIGGLQLDENFYYRALAECPIASVAKGIDRMHNHKTMIGAFSTAKQGAYIEETSALVMPMLRDARRTFSKQEPVYENIKLILLQQMELYRYAHASGRGNTPLATAETTT
ncbi:hypothetical protein ACOI1H_16205 [Loktanella sp. DJP18]|uniref:hypothetical protein n=1 Tax=Loktanella sp. DJP18 TaxID=3409788 RepID=UPI003BB673ED